MKKKLARLEITKIDSDLKNKFKAACIEEGPSMREVIIEFMKEYVVNHKMKESKKGE